jgi:malonyl CoA-acyl carrier protein transacylase
MLGHSIGELAVLASGGAFSVEVGVEIVCRRVLALREARVEDRMAAPTCGIQATRDALTLTDSRSLEIAVINEVKQTVV